MLIASLFHYCVDVCCLTLLPLLSYPIAVFVPRFREKGRDAERNLAILFSVVGYILGFAVSRFSNAGFERVLFDDYLFSGAMLALCTCLHFKASGHTCGCSDPIAGLAMFISPWYLLGYILLIPVVWSSLKLKRHTALQLFVGAIIPVAGMWFFRIIVF